MLCATTRPLHHSLPSTPSLHLRRRAIRRAHFSPMTMSSSAAAAQTIEHVVLFKVKPTTDPSQVNSMVNGLSGLRSLDNVLHLTVGPVLRTRHPSLSFTHLLHSRYQTKAHLAQYSAHPAHLSVVRESVLPILEDIMAVDWVAENLSGSASPPPGAALRVQFMRLKDGVGEREKGEIFEVIGGLTGKVDGVDEISFGENFSPDRAKGFSIGSIGVFSGVKELDDVDRKMEIENEKRKVRDWIESSLIIDYVVPAGQSASL